MCMLIGETITFGSSTPRATREKNTDTGMHCQILTRKRRQHTHTHTPDPQLRRQRQDERQTNLGTEKMCS